MGIQDEDGKTSIKYGVYGCTKRFAEVFCGKLAERQIKEGWELALGIKPSEEPGRLDIIVSSDDFSIKDVGAIYNRTYDLCSGETHKPARRGQEIK